MERLYFTVLEGGTSVALSEVVNLEQCSSLYCGYISYRFPLYPITIVLYLNQPYFNKFSIAFKYHFYPSRLRLFGSYNGLDYKKIMEFEGNQYLSHVFKDLQYFCYIKLVLYEPEYRYANICKQIRLEGMDFYNVTVFATRFACNLEARLVYHPILFRSLEVLYVKAKTKTSNDDYLLRQTYSQRLYDLLSELKRDQINVRCPSEEYLNRLRKYLKTLYNEQYQSDDQGEDIDSQLLKNDIIKLTKDIEGLKTNKQIKINPMVTYYFRQYAHITIKELYLRLLSSTNEEDMRVALFYFRYYCNDNKYLNEEKQIQSSVIEKMLVFFNFYLYFVKMPKIRVTALKILLSFLRQQKPLPYLTYIYKKILVNLFHCQFDNNCTELALRCIYLIYELVSNEIFLFELLICANKCYLNHKLVFLQILYKLTFANVQIHSLYDVSKFILKLLLLKYLSLVDKNRAYNVIAYLAARFGKYSTMSQFYYLNSMIIMSMERIIDQKLNKISVQSNQPNKYQQLYSIRTSCDYCGKQDISFSDENIFDLHINRYCPYFTLCEYCQKNVEIPMLFKHYVGDCSKKHEFMSCKNCNDSILINDEIVHETKCIKKLATKCPLCLTKVNDLLKLKYHILKTKCPNNPRYSY